MVIDPGNSLNSHNASTTKARQQEQTKSESGLARENAPESPSDSVSLSSASRSIAKIEASLAVSSDVDAAKVAEVKASISNGSYKVNAEAIANRLYQDESLLG